MMTCHIFPFDYFSSSPSQKAAFILYKVARFCQLFPVKSLLDLSDTRASNEGPPEGS